MDSYNPSGLTQEEINKLYDNDIETFTGQDDVPEERKVRSMEQKLDDREEELEQ